MAAKFLIRNRGWLISTKSRFGSEKIQHLPLTPFQKNGVIKRQFLTASTVNFDQKSKRLVVKWKDNISDEYPAVWLRDNCQCPACFNQSAQSRSTSFSDLRLDSKPTSSVIEKNNVEVLWEDGHKSAYNFGWLKERSFNKQEQQKWLDSHKAPYKTWLAADFKKIPTFDFQTVMKDDVALLEWLQVLDIWGLSVMNNVPNSLGQAGSLANRVGFIKRTHFGDELDIKVKANPNNLADTSGYFQLHTDLPYYEYMPGINLLHFFIQNSGEGGDSLLSDGFQVAELLRDTDPDAYKCLKETEVTYSDVGHEKGYYFHTINHGPVICESSNKTIKRINYNSPRRDSHLAISIDQVDNWYRAVKKFYHLALDPCNLVKLKVEPGQFLTFDNLRILHGRTGFQGDRHVQGAYVDWDEARSKVRVLKAKLTKT